MRLGDFLDAPATIPVVQRLVTFRLVGTNRSGERVKHEQAQALLWFVTEWQRQEAYRDADKALAEIYKDRPIPVDRLIDERNYHVLFRALRDPSPPHPTFADTVLQLQNALVIDEAQHVWSEYERFREEEFPSHIDEKAFAALVEEAKKNSLSDLLTSSGSSLIRRAWPSLLRALSEK